MLITDKYLAHWYNNGDSFDIISFDLRKAFDRVQQDIVVQSVGFSACVLFNTPGPLLHLGPPGPGPLANPGGRYPTMDGKANTMAKPPDPIATSWPTTTILSGRSS